MAASAMAGGAGVERMDAWVRFRSLSRQRIQEGNLVAGEAVWRVVEADAAGPRFAIGCARSGEVRVECRLDMETWMVTCKVAAKKGAVVTFDLTERERSLEEAVRLMLDSLAWEEGNGSS